ncbi:hypothetical protein QVD99_005835 [Batrachochytrium dendrobatidis]|nr:hypothetical protein QVD99_005835 [Batrachochytrium dendrobatidis]
MKLVDILFVLTAAATANAILIPTDNNGSPKASGTCSQVSGPTDEPSPQIPDQDWQDIMDIINSNTSNQDQHQPMDQPSPSTPKRGRKRPIDEPGSNTSKYDQQQPMDQAGPSASKQSRKQSTDEPGLDIPDKYWQRLIDEINSNTFEDWQELFDIAGLNTPSQAFDPIDQVGSSNFDKYQQQPADQPSSVQDQQQPMEQDQQQPMIHDESGNTVSNQVTGLNERDQRTFDRIRQRLVASKKIAKEKREEYWDYEAIGLEQQSALERGEEISGSTYDPNVEKKLKEEYVAARIKVSSIRQDFKRFMKRRGLEFQEPDSDSD